ncbi:MAG TPA: hypothetical protein DCL77_02195 [Prolixibacteraceae bacterium]|jgi:hypothetical protein|nr:hypothetical protein [Prolixibacteraceae bacterium]
MKYLYSLIFLLLLFSGKSQTVVPQKIGGSKFALSCANVYFEIDSARGARFTSFKLNDNEIMYIDFKTTDNAGSTFWPSPQSVWGWPPAVNLNNNPYKTTINQNKIKFTGTTDSKSMLRFYKTISANILDTSIIIDYCIKNEKTTLQRWAPWEVTRVLNGGLSVFGLGEGGVTGDMAGRTQNISNYIWYDQDQTSGGAGSKFFCNGKGWLAHVIDGDMLFIKKFEDIVGAKAATGEAEVEMYTAPDRSYTELENQGNYTSIAGKDSLTWRVKWVARKLPSSVNVSIGSSSLTSYILAVLKREAPVTKVEINNLPIANIYPNPASRLLTIETGLTEGKHVTLRIFDLQGRNVLTHSINQARGQVNVENLQQGIYFYDLRQGDSSLSKGKIVIKH